MSDTPWNDSDPAAGEAAATEEEERLGDAEGALASCSNVECGNCVKHARCLQPALPYGLFSCADKKAIINSQTPMVGSVAIMNAGPDCHVGYVYKVTGSGSGATIFIDEANFNAGKCGVRNGTAAQLKIAGYFKP